MGLEIIQYLVLNDNYNYLLRDEATGTTAVVDPSMMLPTMKVLNQRDLRLNYVLQTHHHYDHVDGTPPLSRLIPDLKVVGPKDEHKRFPCQAIELNDGDVFELGETPIRLLSVPGHTSSHCAYYIESIPAVFSGDALFTIGCGRIFEGSFETMYNSLQKLADLPPETKLYCAHEYTLENGAFALSIEPGNQDLVKRLEVAERLRSDNLPTVPSTIAEELKTNPFLRCDSPEIKNNIGLPSGSEVEVFEKIRKMKNSFKG